MGEIVEVLGIPSMSFVKPKAARQDSVPALSMDQERVLTFLAGHLSDDHAVPASVEELAELMRLKLVAVVITDEGRSVLREYRRLQRGPGRS